MTPERMAERIVDDLMAGKSVEGFSLGERIDDEGVQYVIDGDDLIALVARDESAIDRIAKKLDEMAWEFVDSDTGQEVVRRMTREWNEDEKAAFDEQRAEAKKEAA